MPRRVVLIPDLPSVTSWNGSVETSEPKNEPAKALLRSKIVPAPATRVVINCLRVSVIFFIVF
jgi:hypothetical protein